MDQTAIVGSIGPNASATGERAARHLNVTFRGLLRDPRAIHRDRYMNLVTGEMHPMGNLAVVAEADDPATARDAIEPLLGNELPAAVLFPCGVSARVAGMIRESGFGIDERMPAMAVEIDAMAPTSLPSGYRWARVGEGAEGRAWTESLATGYEIPLPLARLFGPEALGADPAPDAAVQFFAVLRDDRIVSTSLLCLADGLAGIYCVATLPEERGRGLGAHATAEALREARTLGYRVGVLQSSAAGHGVYLRLGFQDLASVPMFVRLPA